MWIIFKSIIIIVELFIQFIELKNLERRQDIIGIFVALIKVNIFIFI